MSLATTGIVIFDFIEYTFELIFLIDNMRFSSVAMGGDWIMV